MSQIRGISIHSDIPQQRGKNAALRSAAWSLDFLVGVLCGLIIHAAHDDAPAWGLVPLASTLLLVFGIALLGRVLARRTLGEWVFDLLPARRFGLELLTRSTPIARHVLGGVALSLLLFGAAVAITDGVLDHPVLLPAHSLQLDPFLPDTSSDSDWTIASFYFALIAAPRVYQGNPVFYGLQYQKGPPSVFIDHFSARWDFPDVQWTVEGPKTPRVNPAMAERGTLKECLLQWGGLDSSCQALRQEVLGRHVREMRAATHAGAGASHWTLRWFHVQNPALHPDDIPQGFYLQARGKLLEEDRYVFVSARGRHQALILRAPLGAGGDHARALFHQIAASVRMQDELSMGRLWSEQQLQQIHTSQVRDWKQWSSVFALLLGRLSVDPKDRQAYYHLGGIAHAALKRAVQGYPTWVKGLAEMIQACERYLADLAPNSPEHRGLQMLAVDAEKALKGERL